MRKHARATGIRWGVTVVIAFALVPLALLGSASPAEAGLLGTILGGGGSAGPTQPYIVTDLNSTGSLTDIVDSVGGLVTGALSFINGAVTDLTSAQVSSLAAQPGIVVTPDLTLSVAGGFEKARDARAPAAVFPEDSGASQLWAQGDNGSGVNVAVVDTGIDNLPDFAGRLLPGVDLSGEGNPNLDSYGHGTFVAGLIAGDGASSNGTYSGEAPGAGLVPVKVAGASGQTHMATVISGIGWVISHRQSEHIGVLNLSLGVQPVESTVIDPLDQAVEAAWNAGITVVVSAGNAGPFNGTILSPGDDPLVITAGALDDQGQTVPSAASMATFSSVGPTNPDGWFKPDLVAEGAHVVSLRAPGSTVDTANPSARIGAGNFVGSGTSFSSAIVSGAAALLLADHPGLSPNAVKGALLDSALPGPVGNPFVDGHGQLDVAAAAGDSAVLNQATDGGGGVLGGILGGLLGSRGTPMGTTVSLGTTWKTSSWNGSQWNGSSWSGSQWNGSQWNGSSWSGSSWSDAYWSGSQWNGSQWNGSSWSGSQWNGSSWSGSQWNGSQWNGSQWNGSSWSGSQWNGSQWNGSQWN